MSFKFEKLEVWKKAIEFSYHIYELTRSFPREETYILTSQIMRAADSTALNIAEGSTGQTNAEFRQFWSMYYALQLKLCLAFIWGNVVRLSVKMILKNCMQKPKPLSK